MLNGDIMDFKEGIWIYARIKNGYRKTWLGVCDIPTALTVATILPFKKRLMIALEELVQKKMSASSNITASNLMDLILDVISKGDSDHDYAKAKK